MRCLGTLRRGAALALGLLGFIALFEGPVTRLWLHLANGNFARGAFLCTAGPLRAVTPLLRRLGGRRARRPRASPLGWGVS